MTPRRNQEADEICDPEERDALFVKKGVSLAQQQEATAQADFDVLPGILHKTGTSTSLNRPQHLGGYVYGYSTKMRQVQEGTEAIRSETVRSSA
jgi:hypothetical protein